MRRGLAVVAALVTMAGLSPSVVNAEPQAERPEAGAAPRSVTLITGDRVMVGDRQVSVIPGPGRDGMGFRQRTTRDKHVVVTPVDALPLVRAGKLDERLFDVTTLIEQQRDDQSRDTLPLIIGYQPHVRAAVTLSSINATKFAADKARLGELWPSLAANGDIAKVWLDGQAKLDDAESHAQIGAPQAWQSGYTGKGVTVAVIDGGYDPAHPDLAGVVTEARDFTGRPAGVRDEYGHGTHVAATIAGAGIFGGAAPDAKLLVGKVCGMESCDDSAIVEAMEWAAPRAKVVNLSLGGGATDGTDPLSLAVNRLTEQHGTLFVIAAGNEGDDQSVATPAAADAALAVASVNKRDALSRFSSRGPRVGDFAVKPDISAPGEAIGAARAAGTSMGTPIDALHTRASGTSMATPHVAGAAAALAQRHPGWTAAQLKAALTSSAKPIGRSVYEEGTGRLDLAAAVTQNVYATPPNLNFGVLKFPHTGLPPVTRKLTYHNDSDAPVTLPLKAEGSEAVTFGAAEITVPAKGQADVDVTLTPAKLPVGSASIRVVAGLVRTAVGVTAEPEAYELTIKTIGRDGKPVNGDLSVVPLDNDEDVELPEPVDGTTKVRVLKGGYGLNTLISEAGTHSWASSPRITVDKPGITVTVDARLGKRVGATLDRQVTRRFIQLDSIYQTTDGGSRQEGLQSKGADEFYAVPVTADPSYFNFGVYQVLAAKEHEYFVASPTAGGIPASLTPRVRDRDMGTERARYRAQGTPANATRSSVPFYVAGQFVAFGVLLDMTIPSRRTEHFSAHQDIRWTLDFFQRPIDVPTMNNFDGHIGREHRSYRPGESSQRTWNTAVMGTDISYRPFNGINRNGNSIYAQVWPFAPGEPDASDEFVFGSPYINSKLTLSTSDGKVIGTGNGVFGFFTVPAEPASYVLDVAATRAPRWSLHAPSSDTRYTFTSGKTPDGVRTYLPLQTIRVTGQFDDLNRAPGCGVFPLAITVVPQAGSNGGAAIRTVTAEVSTDDGKTWRTAPVRGSGKSWRALVAHPKNAEFVSLRVKAVDVNGDSVQQTTIRAYGLTR